MSFAFTPAEQQRVTLAALGGIHLDPIGYVDLSTIIVLSTMYFIELIALCYQVYNRRYPPLRVKNVPLMCSLYVGAVIWFVGDISTGGLIHISQTAALRNCKLTLIWLRACLGSYFVTAMFSLRCFSLYYVFCRGKAFTGRVVYLSLSVTVLALLLFGTIATVVPSELTTHYVEIFEICDANRNFIIAMLLICWLIMAFTAVMSWRMRNIPFSFNERMEVFASFVLLIVVSTLNTVCLLAINVYPASLGWRTALVYANHVGASVAYWIIMGEATYNCIFNREKYLQYWIGTLREDGTKQQYQYVSDHNNEATLNLVEHSQPTATVSGNDDYAHSSK
ncbi:hypothetical protein EV174_000709, partial [Coemansia sp. RSA 2320]